MPDEKPQTGWFHLPFEIRIMIIEMMDTKSRGNLSSCSKLCCTEVRRSKNFIKTIHIIWSSSRVNLKVGIQNHNFNMNFSKINENNKEKCRISYERFSVRGFSKQNKEVVGSMHDVALEHINTLVNDAIYLEQIVIDSDGFPFDKSSIRHLRKLNIIKIRLHETAGICFSILECGFISINQLISASKIVEIEDTNINVQQLIKFKASKIHLKNVKFQPTQLNRYLKLWNMNRINENVNEIEIECSNGVNLYNFAEDVVSGLNVFYSKKHQIILVEKRFRISNIIGELAKLRLTASSFCLKFKISEERDRVEEELYRLEERRALAERRNRFSETNYDY